MHKTGTDVIFLGFFLVTIIFPCSFPKIEKDHLGLDYLPLFYPGLKKTITKHNHTHTLDSLPWKLLYFRQAAEIFHVREETEGDIDNTHGSSQLHHLAQRDKRFFLSR